MKCECYNREKWPLAHDSGAKRYDSVQDGTKGTPIFLGWV